MAITFTADNYFTASPGTWVNLTTCTITCWVHFTTLNASGTNRMVGSDDNWEVRCTTDWNPGSPRFTNELFSSTVTQPPPALSTTVVATNTWYHVAATVNPSKFGQIFINGLLEASGTSADTATGTTLGIGSRAGASTGVATNGVLDDVRVYTRILSADEIMTIYSSSGRDSIYYGLQNRWLMNEFSDGTLAAGTVNIIDEVGLQNGTPTSLSGSFPSYFTTRLSMRRNY